MQSHLISLLLLALGVPEELPLFTLPREERPRWLREEGIVMAGSWEPLIFRVRRDGRQGYEATPEEKRAYAEEHSPEMLKKLKAMGVNFVMMHAYKGFGMEAEAESLRDAKAFAALCRSEGLRVGCYAFSGTIGWELFLKERPEAGDWVVRDHQGKPLPYGSMTFRHYLDRRHPDAAEYLQKVIRYAVEEIQVDLLHFDNYCVGPGYGPRSLEGFRRWIAGRLGAEEIARRLGAGGLESVKLPFPASPQDPLGREFLRFQCRWLAESYWDLARYARGLKRDVLVECNPGGVGARLEPPMDHWLLLRGGEAFWDEGASPGWDGRALRSRIRTYKVGRRLGNMTFAYVTCPLEAAESMAFNLDCLGSIAWFEYGRLVSKPGASDSVSDELGPYIKLYRKLQMDWGGRKVLADVGAFRPLTTQLLFPSGAKAAWEAEELLIRGRVPFQIASAPERDRLDDFRALLCAGCTALDDAELEAVVEFLRKGGGCVIVEPAGRLDADLKPRVGSSLEEFLERPLGEKVFRIQKGTSRCAYFPAMPPVAELIEGLRWAAGGSFSAEVRAPAHVAAEFLKGSGSSLGIHLVNYASRPAQNVSVRFPGGLKDWKAAWITAQAPEPVGLRVDSWDPGEEPGGVRSPSATCFVSVPDVAVHGFLMLEPLP